MPSNPLKKIKVIIGYMIALRRNIAFDGQPLPVSGDIVLKIRDFDHKIIRLRERSIYTVFHSSDERPLPACLYFGKQSSMYERILHVDPVNRVLQGVFYNGYHPDFRHRETAKFHRPLRDLFVDLITGSHIKTVKVKRYAKSLLVACLRILERNAWHIPEQQRKKAESFLIHTYREIIGSGADSSVHLSVSHGDIKPENLIEHQGRLIPIDWECCDYRLPSYDFLKFRFRFPGLGERFYRRMAQAIMDRLQTERPNRPLHMYFEPPGSKHCPLFFLEDLKLRLILFETRGFAQHFSDYILKTIQKMESEASEEKYFVCH